MDEGIGIRDLVHLSQSLISENARFLRGGKVGKRPEIGGRTREMGHES